MVKHVNVFSEKLYIISVGYTIKPGNYVPSESTRGLCYSSKDSCRSLTLNSWRCIFYRIFYVGWEPNVIKQREYEIFIIT